MEEKKENKKKTGIAVIAYVFMLTAVFLFILAGHYVEAKAATVQGKILFQDNSGKYLQKSGGDWYLKDAEGHKLTGVQYLDINEVDFFSRGRYMFDKNGKLVRKVVVYYFNNQNVHGVIFNGYYAATNR